MPALPSNRRPGRLADYSADHRLLILAAMAIVAGTGGAFSAWALLKLIALATNLLVRQFLLRSGGDRRKRAAAGAAHSRRRRPHRRADGAVRIGQDPRPRHSRSDRDHPLRREQASLKVALLKPLSSAVSIGSGGPFGAEGPIIMTGGAIGSLFAQLFQLERRRAQDLAGRRRDRGHDRHLRHAVRGDHARGRVAAVRMEAAQLRAGGDRGPGRPRMASAAGRRRARCFRSPRRPGGDRAGRDRRRVGTRHRAAGRVLSFALYRIEDGFHRLPIHWMWWPAIGAVVVGIGGLIDLRVLGAGYGSIQALLDGIWSSRPFSCCSSSRRSCGWSRSARGPRAGSSRRLLILGGCAGFLIGQYLPGDPGFWAMVGMAGVMSGTMRAPMTGALFAAELTNHLSALPETIAAGAPPTR